MGTLSVLADISTVLVVLEFMLVATIPLAVLYFANTGMRRLNRSLRPWLRQVLAVSNKVRDAAGRGSRSVARPFVAASVLSAQAQGLFRGLGKALSGKSWKS